ncbi:MAG: ABC transporter permease [Lachnospiraceae bacterium]|nr:ABC transporter permease [Lachnospiraceae bacterium]
MWRYILKRLAMMVLVVLGVAIVIFTILYFVPGDPAQIILGSTATPEQLAAKRAELGIDKPYLVQLGNYLLDLLRLDFGESYMYGTPVIDELMIRLPRTFLLAFLTIVVQTIIGIPLGITAAVHAGKWQDSTSIVVSLIGIAIPGFWLSLMAVLVFSVKLRILPAFGIESWQNWILPVLTGALAGIGMNARQTRAAMLDVIHSDYVTTARAKGLSEHDVIYKHALPNALIPVITMIGGSFAMALGGAIVTEAVFVMPGVGLYMTNAISNLDYVAVRSSVVILSVFFSLIMLITDLIYAFVDPRIKAQYIGR